MILTDSIWIFPPLKVKRGGKLLTFEKVGSILRLNRPKISSEIDVIQWDRIKSGKDPAVKLNKVFESPTEDNSNAETSDDPDIGRFLIQAIQFLNQAIQFLIQAIQFLIQAIQSLIQAIQFLTQAIQFLIQAIQFLI